MHGCLLHVVIPGVGWERSRTFNYCCSGRVGVRHFKHPAIVRNTYRVINSAGFLLSHKYQFGTPRHLCQQDVPNWYSRYMMEKCKKLKQESDSPLDALRIQRTNLTQDEFAMRCGIPRTTYLRWISGRTEARPTIPQLKKICRELKIELINELPDEFSPPGLQTKE
ncbi:helix-turn-helix domain-containing protein [Nodularia chucula]|uniref:helix-turn-helix domain-containing protein n=1 Tax=Nodularia chucula TaxID=3093667 RepID=UPI0039C5AE5B